MSIFSEPSPATSAKECSGTVVSDLTEKGGDSLFILQLKKNKQVVVVYSDADVKDTTNGKAYTEDGLLQVGAKAKVKYTVMNDAYYTERFKDKFKPSDIYLASYVEFN
jgi:hypothetical protein